MDPPLHGQDSSTTGILRPNLLCSINRSNISSKITPFLNTVA